MLKKFVSYRINNSKITMMVLSIILLMGVFSWSIIPKQYNPDIVIPAFQIIIPAPGYSSNEVQHLLVTPLERKLKEIEGVEHYYSVVHRDYVATMVMFYVGTNKETAFTRLFTKINAGMDEKPSGVMAPTIKPIDPDDIPIYTLALSWSGSNNNTGKDSKLIKAKNMAIDIVKYLQNVPEVGVVYIVGGQKESINIKIDPAALEVRGTDVMQIYDVVAKNNLVMPGGSIDQAGVTRPITINGNLNDVDQIKKLIVNSMNGTPLYLDDVAAVYKGVTQEKYKTWFVNSESGDINSSVFIGIAKKKGTNSVDAVAAITKNLEQIKSKLPAGFHMDTIQDEGKTAKEATDKLLHELLQSVLILFIIMLIFLGAKDALSSVFAIPLVLSITFVISLVIGDNINRITLFSLILVLGMLVDDSIIVVENISRHIKEATTNGTSIMDAILDATSEIGGAVLFSTITKIVSFLGMFFVSGMMGQYMGPIPKYAIIALTASLFIAFSVNPFFSYVFANKEIKLPSRFKKIIDTAKVVFAKLMPKKLQKKSDHQEPNAYTKLITFLLKDESAAKRKNIKRLFWGLLILFFVVFPSLGVFRWRMLPKSNTNQVYVRLDSPANYAISRTNKLAEDFNKVISKYITKDKESTIKDMKIIKDISYRIGTAPTQDFANTFRGSMMREGEQYVSMKLNLVDKENRKISSEAFVLNIRPLLQTWLSTNYPEVKMRLLEDPPGPPVKSTFMLRVAGDTSVNYENLENLSDWIYAKISGTLRDYDVVDYSTSKERYQSQLMVDIDHESLSRAGLNVQQVSATLYTLFGGSTITAYHDENAQEPIGIHMTVEDWYSNLDSISFTNMQGQKIPLTSIAKLRPASYDTTMQHDDGKATVYIYGEMGNNSVIYPVIKLLTTLLDKDFWDNKFDIVDWSLYKIDIREKGTGKMFTLSFGGEWELSMDTFRDLGGALMVTLFLLYVLVSGRFKSFRVGGVVMLPFLLGFFGVLPGFSLLFLVGNEYFSATSMIGVIALAGIAVGNSIIFLEYYEELHHRGLGLRDALIQAGTVRLKPIILTSLTAILGAMMIIGDPVWSGLAWSLIWGLSVGAVLTVILVPVFIYDIKKEK